MGLFGRDWLDPPPEIFQVSLGLMALDIVLFFVFMGFGIKAAWL